MNQDEILKRINELAHLKKSRGLNCEEEAERKTLHEEYLKNFREAFREQLDNTYIVNEETGEKTKLKPKQ